MRRIGNPTIANNCCNHPFVGKLLTSGDDCREKFKIGFLFSIDNNKIYLILRAFVQ